MFLHSRNPNLGTDDARASSPAAKLLEWPEFNLDTRMYKDLSPAMTNIPDPSGIGCKFWNDYLPKLNAALGRSIIERHQNC